MREIVADWLLGDFAYAVLPIVFIFVVRSVYPRVASTGVWLMPEWSFASVIFYGVSLRHHIQHNVRYKRANRSALDWGAQIYSLLLILSAVTLALAMATEKDDSAKHEFVQVAQMIFFGGGIASLLLDSYVGWWNRRQREDAGRPLTTGDALEYARWDANSAVHGTRAVLFVLQRRLRQVRIASLEDVEKFYTLSLTIEQLRLSVADLTSAFGRIEEAVKSKEGNAAGNEADVFASGAGTVHAAS